MMVELLSSLLKSRAVLQLENIALRHQREFEKHHEAASRRVIKRIMATSISASVVCGKRSYAHRNRRFRQSQAKIRSTRHLQGKTAKPFCPFGLRTMSN
jgi:hypothetical protein